MAFRRWSALRRPTGWGSAVVVACLLAGLLLGTVRAYSGGKDIRNRSSDLSVLITNAEDRVSALDTTAAGLQHQIDAAAAAQAESPQVASVNDEVDALGPAAGLTALRGPGLRVSLTDAPRDSDGNYPVGVDPDDLVVHQQDVQAVVNALWAGGAEAMMIMDQRVIATSAVRCIGNTLLLQGRTYSPPFVITAIGDSSKMLDAVKAEPGVVLFLRYVTAYHLGFTAEDLDDVVVPPYAGVVRMTSASKEPK